MNQEILDSNTQNSTSANKRAARLAAVQSLYQLQYDDNACSAVRLDEDEGETAPADQELLQAILKTVRERQSEIETYMTEALSAEWPPERLERILRDILRAGIAELLFNHNMPAGLLITDYIDVAHAFFGGKEPALVNAVLDKTAKKIRS